MSTREYLRRGGAFAVVLLLGASASAQDLQPPFAETPKLGTPATPEQIAGWDLTIGPDGENLPPGTGTVADGAEVYAAKCAACHGIDGAGQPNDALVGGHGTLAGDAPVRTIGSYWPYATTVFDYVRRAMPYLQPQSLGDDEVYAVTAYLLHLNGIIGEDFVADASTLPRVAMPNAGGFRVAYPEWDN
jgi:S-disulfanyl-L-cysteine oxidoreductase SoxD